MGRAAPRTLLDVPPRRDNAAALSFLDSSLSLLSLQGLESKQNKRHSRNVGMSAEASSVMGDLERGGGGGGGGADGEGGGAGAGAPSVGELGSAGGGGGGNGGAAAVASTRIVVVARKCVRKATVFVVLTDAPRDAALPFRCVSALAALPIRQFRVVVSTADAFPSTLLKRGPYDCYAWSFRRTPDPFEVPRRRRAGSRTARRTRRSSTGRSPRARARGRSYRRCAGARDAITSPLGRLASADLTVTCGVLGGCDACPSRC
jgi:hypothetical protein